MAPRAPPRPAPLLSSAHVLVSQSVGPRRAGILAALDVAVAPLTCSGALDRVAVAEPAEVQARLTDGQQPPLVMLDASQMDDPAMQALVRGLHLREISNVLKHAEALRRVATQVPEVSTSAGPPRFGLVLEDDAVFGPGVQEALQRAVRDAPADADLVFLGLPTQRPPPPPGAPAAFDDAMDLFKGHVLPACESYLVTPAAAARLAAALLPVRLPMTGMLTYLARRGVYRGYAATPNAFVDGSKVGVVTSSLLTNNQLTWHQGYCRLDAIVRAGSGVPPGAVERLPQPEAGRAVVPLADAAAREAFEALWAEHKGDIGTHPDALLLRAEFLERCGRPDDARDVYEQALRAYERDDCVVNGSSAFLRRLIATYRE